MDPLTFNILVEDRVRKAVRKWRRLSIFLFCALLFAAVVCTVQNNAIQKQRKLIVDLWSDNEKLMKQCYDSGKALWQ